MKNLAWVLVCIVLVAVRGAISIYESLEITKGDAENLLLKSIGEGSVQQGNFIIVGKAKELSKEAQVSGVRELILLAKEYSKTDEFKSEYKKWRKGKINPNEKTKLGLPKLGKMLENRVDNKVDKASLEKKYPSEPIDLIKQRLKDFLEISADVDFDAELKPNSSTFKNPDYEKKNGYWKMCYRAGKEVVSAAREEAKKWLDELNEK